MTTKPRPAGRSTSTNQAEIEALRNESDSELEGFLGGDADAPMGFEDEIDRGRDTRASETRQAEQRSPDTWVPSSSLPDPEPVPGMVFRWIRTDFGSKGDDAKNVSGRFREGWRPVKPEEQPLIADSLTNGGKGTDRIVIGNLMLVTAEKRIIDQRKAHFTRQTKRQAEGVQRQLLRIQDARMPILRPAIHSTTSKQG